MRSIAAVLALLIGIPHSILAQDYKEDAPLRFSQGDIDSVLQYYSRLKVIYNQGNMDSFIQSSSVLRKEDPLLVKGIFKGIRKLPDLKRDDQHILVILDSNIIATISIARLENGILDLNGRSIQIKRGLSLKEALQSYREGYTFLKGLQQILIPNAMAADGGGIAAILKAIWTFLAGLFGGKKAGSSEAAQAAREEAYRSGGVLKENTLFGENPAHPSFIQYESEGGTYPGTNDRPLDDAYMKELNDTLSKGGCEKTKDFNSRVLKNIQKFKGGGYDVEKGGFNVPLRIAGHSVARGKQGPSHCSVASYTAFMTTLNEYLQEKNIKLTPQQASHFQSGKEDNDGVWGIWNNNFGGAGDIPRYINTLISRNAAPDNVPDFGAQSNDPAKACPGDFLKLDRKKGPGHSVVFTHFKGTGANKEICYWSSNKSTNGYGTKCEKVSGIKRYSFLKINNPTAITKIPAQTPFRLNDASLNGHEQGGIYKQAYNRDGSSAISQADRFYASGGSVNNNEQHAD